MIQQEQQKVEAFTSHDTTKQLNAFISTTGKKRHDEETQQKEARTKKNWTNIIWQKPNCWLIQRSNQFIPEKNTTIDEKYQQLKRTKEPEWLLYRYGCIVV